MRFFRPNQAQDSYIQAVGKQGGYIVIFAAGNGVGKTAATIAIIAAIIWPEFAPLCFSSPIFKIWPHPKDIRIISTPQQIAEGGSIQKEIKRWFPADHYVALKAGKPYISQYLARGFTINLMSYDMAPSAFEGATCGLVVFDEPPPKEIFNACTARMRAGGRLLFPGTPLTSAAWIMDDLVSKADGKYCQLVHGDIEQNCKEHAPNGILAHDDIARMLKNYDADEIEARAHGRFMHLSGRIFKGFDRAVHVAKEDIVPPEEGIAHYMAVDPAIGKPLACIWAYVDRTGTVCIYDEHPEFEFEGARDSGLTVSDYVQIFKNREGNKNISTRILDRHFGNVRRTLGGMSLKQEFSEAGLDFSDSYQLVNNESEVETGILKVKEYLKWGKDRPLDSLNRPKLLISPKCHNTIVALERWSRDAKTSKPREEYKDFADTVRYLLMASPEIESQRQWPGPQPAYYGVKSLG